LKTVAIIPARGGSKRIPRKNIKPFAGLPIIAYSIRAARAAQLFDRIIVSTDDDEIAVVAAKHGAETPFRRPTELADDFTGTDAVLQHALHWLEQAGSLFEYFCCIYPTAPFVTAADLRRGFDALRSHKATTAVSVTTYPSTIFRAFKMTADNRLAMLWPHNFDQRSQDFEQVWHDAGQFYWGDVPKYLHAGRLFSHDTVPVSLPRYIVQDIDTKEDWIRAENMYEGLRRGVTDDA
jgi:pseudaminic acid cytidylyltransferase